MKDISLRPKLQLMNLFDAVQKLENLPSTNRNTLIDRALDIALSHKSLNWQAVSEVAIPNTFNARVPNHVVLKVDNEKFTTINEQIKETFSVAKITIPYTLKLLLTLYFIHLKQQTDNASQSENMGELLAPDMKINPLLLKQEFEQSIYSGKKRLLELCKVYLRKKEDVKTQLSAMCEATITNVSQLVNLNDYFSPKSSEGVINSTYLAKVLAGLFILRVELAGEVVDSRAVLDKIVRQLEQDLETVGAVAPDIDSTDYYKNVYAKMMGGKI